jgi:hypothetical protein
MLRSDRSEPTVIPFIFAGAETETVVAETQAEPTITEAYNAEHEGIEATSKKNRKEESGRNTTLAAEEATARSLAETEHKAPRRREQTLQEAHDGVIPEEEADFGADNIPEDLQEFDRDDLAAAMMRLGLEEADLEDPRWINALKVMLENQAGEDEAGVEEGNESDEEAENETTEEAKAESEEKKPALPIPQSVEEYVAGDPAKLEALNKHIDATYQRARAINDPVMTDVFVRGLASALQTPAEQIPMLKDTVDLLAYGGYAMVEQAIPKMLPALVDEYMGQRFEAILEHFAPGLKAMHNEALLANTWDSVLSMEEFKDCGLPKWDDQKAFNAAAEKVHKDNPWLATWDPGPNVPIKEALLQKAVLTAKLLKGETYRPEQRAKAIADAIETGKKSATTAHRRVSASRILRGGKTRGVMGKEEERESLLSAYNAHHDRDGGIA